VKGVAIKTEMSRSSDWQPVETRDANTKYK